jgi:hypothetical protein
MALWSTEWNIEVPIKTEEHRGGFGSAYYTGGAALGRVEYESAHLV